MQSRPGNSLKPLAWASVHSPLTILTRRGPDPEDMPGNTDGNQPKPVAYIRA